MDKFDIAYSSALNAVEMAIDDLKEIFKQKHF